MLQICFQSEKNGLILRDTVRNSENTFRISGMGAEKVQNSCFLSVKNKLISCDIVRNSENMLRILGSGAEYVQNYFLKIGGWRLWSRQISRMLIHFYVPYIFKEAENYYLFKVLAKLGDYKHNNFVKIVH